MRFGFAVVGGRDGTKFPEGVWVKEYDPDAEDETVLTFTDVAAEALSFGSRQAAFETLLYVSTERPVDREGHLLRPLRDAYDVDVRPIPESDAIPTPED